MADRESRGSTPGWEPLIAYLKRALPRRRSPLRAGEPVGPYRLDAMFAEKRAHGDIYDVRGYPKEIIGAPQLIPHAEYFGYLVEEDSGRLFHPHANVRWYGAEVLSAEPGSGEQRAKVPAEEPSIRGDKKNGVARLLSFLNTLERASTKTHYDLTCTEFGTRAFTVAQFHQARDQLDRTKKFGIGERK